MVICSKLEILSRISFSRFFLLAMKVEKKKK